MDKSYLIETNKLNGQYQKYLQDFDLIFRESLNTGKDSTAYILKVLQKDNNPEIGRALIESAFGHNLTTIGLLKIIVKILYITGHIQTYRYSMHHQLRSNIDEALQKITGNKAELVRRKYPLLLEKLNKENIQPKTGAALPDKAAAAENMIEHINRQYINFVRKPLK
ncbi:MAG: hypothetical protein LBQ83_00340 [Candidatus Margulisbacteria bacterium]|jgi:hypothetical protein|nr:hypothetical protein [Candidatus Margulisiibacteriota bacterium]